MYCSEHQNDLGDESNSLPAPSKKKKKVVPRARGGVCGGHRSDQDDTYNFLPVSSKPFDNNRPQ